MTDQRASLIKLHASKSGYKGKVNAKCIECIYDESGGGGSWRQQVEACTSTTCPLYEIRPTSSAETVELSPESVENPVDS